MGKTKLIRIDMKLIQVFENIRRGVAEQLKKQYNLQEIIVPFTLSSEILAAEKLGKCPKFKVKKTGMNTGILELIWN
jgi:hypothetical protein